MASKNTQVSIKVTRKSYSIAKKDNTFSNGLWTLNKSKVVATMTDRVGDDHTKTRIVIVLGTRKDESSESKKLASISEDFVSNEVSHDKSSYDSNVNSSTRIPFKVSYKRAKASTKSPSVRANEDDEGWKLVTRRKKVVRKDSWKAHERAERVPDNKQGARKQVKKLFKEDMGHGYH
ncbi:hypothetical protein ACH5RR_032900 [Cinchona calisaya]|uniref:Uncharacterized protein n=1 Tax=Cinchona calisaya TaxID=153742 RepID=A0ABD2YKL7_9GENT